HALGWALVDSLWQDALAAAGLAALLALLPVRAARIRHALATLALGWRLALPLASAVRLSGTSPWTDDVITATSPVTPGPTSGPDPQAAPAAPTAAAPVAARIRAALEPALPWVVLVWFGGVVVLSLRLASGWLVTRQLGRVGTASVPDSCREAVARQAARLRISRPVRVLQSAVVQVPAVIGWLRPVILLPASALTGLTPLQLDALLAHELAHVRRYDYLVNLIQSVIETLLFYHPAVWWVSQQVRDEREHCCDDLAVAVCGDPHFYARALLGMERLRVTPPGFVLAAAGRGGSLMGRIRRLVAPVQTEIFPRWMAGVIAVALALGGGAHVARGTAARVPSDGGGMRTATLDSLIHRVETLRSPDARHEAVKTLGRRRDREWCRRCWPSLNRTPTRRSRTRRSRLWARCGAAPAWAPSSISPAPTRTRASAARRSRPSVTSPPPRWRSTSWSGSRTATPMPASSKRQSRRSGTWAARKPSRRWRAWPVPSPGRRYGRKRWSSTPGLPHRSPRWSCWWTDSRTTARPPSR